MYSLIIIDDEEKIVSGISLLFPWQEIGFTVTGTFTSAQSALAFIKKQPVDVIMTDIEMPDMNGIQLSEILMQDYPDTQIVFFSSYNKYEYFRAAIQNGIADFLMKPIMYAQLLECFETIRQKLDRKKNSNHYAPPEFPNSLDDQVIDRIRQYLEENYQDATLEEAAELVNLSASYLSRLFKEKAGISFRDLLLKTRMEKARQMVEDINFKMYDIAYFIGYDNPKNFSRAYKAYYGESPVEYRKRKAGES